MMEVKSTTVRNAQGKEVQKTTHVLSAQGKEIANQMGLLINREAVSYEDVKIAADAAKKGLQQQIATTRENLESELRRIGVKGEALQMALKAVIAGNYEAEVAKIAILNKVVFNKRNEERARQAVINRIKLLGVKQNATVEDLSAYKEYLLENGLPVPKKTSDLRERHARAVVSGRYKSPTETIQPVATYEQGIDKVIPISKGRKRVPLVSKVAAGVAAASITAGIHGAGINPFHSVSAEAAPAPIVSQLSTDAKTSTPTLPDGSTISLAEKPTSEVEIKTPTPLPELTAQEKEMQKNLENFERETVMHVVVDGKQIDFSIPFAENDPFYGYPLVSFADGSVSSKQTAQDSQQRLNQLVQSGQYTAEYHKLLASYTQAEKAYQDALQTNPGLNKLEFFMEKHATADAFLWNIDNIEERAAYQAARELGVYEDCNGLVYNALRFAYDQQHGDGAFATFIKTKVPSLQNFRNPSAYVDYGHFANPEFADHIGTPPVTEYRPGDIIVVKDPNGSGKMIHGMVVVGWFKTADGQTALRVGQATDESNQHGTFFNDIIVDADSADKPIEDQDWRSLAIGKVTSIGSPSGDPILGSPFSGKSYTERLVTPQGQKLYSVYRMKQ